MSRRWHTDVIPVGDHVSIGLVGCGKRKLDRPAPARDLYQGELFRRAAAYCEATYDHWFVLSAQHYLVHPDEILAPYDRTLAKMTVADRRHWAGMVESGLRCGHGCMTTGRDWPNETPRLQLGRWVSEDRDHRRADVYLHAGNDYCGALLAELARMGAHDRRWLRVHRPVQGLGIGEQLHWYGARLVGSEDPDAGVRP